MPTYEYLREDDTVFDHVQRITEPALKVCPTTGQKCKRIIPKRKVPFGFRDKPEGTSYSGDDCIDWQ